MIGSTPVEVPTYGPQDVHVVAARLAFHRRRTWPLPTQKSLKARAAEIEQDAIEFEIARRAREMFKGGMRRREVADAIGWPEGRLSKVWSKFRMVREREINELEIALHARELFDGGMRRYEAAAAVGWPDRKLMRVWMKYGIGRRACAIAI